MDDVRLAPTVGIAACVAVMIVLAIPFLLLPSASASTYYGAGVFNPLFAGVFALVCVIVFAAGRTERSDPALAAGVSLVFGLFILGFTLAWGTTVPREVVLSFPTDASFQYHRYVLILAALAIPLSATWYTRALKLI